MHKPKTYKQTTNWVLASTIVNLSLLTKDKTVMIHIKPNADNISEKQWCNILTINVIEFLHRFDRPVKGRKVGERNTVHKNPLKGKIVT